MKKVIILIGLLFLFDCSQKLQNFEKLGTEINIDSLVNFRFQYYPDITKKELDSLYKWLDNIREDYPLNFDSLVNFHLEDLYFLVDSTFIKYDTIYSSNKRLEGIRLDSILYRDSIFFKYRYILFSVIYKDTLNSIDTLNSLRIEYRDTIEYDTILFNDTFYNDTNRIDSIVRKGKRKNYNILVKDTIREDTVKEKDTLEVFYDTVRVLTIEYRDTIEYDTILLNDTSYNDTDVNRIDSIVRKGKRTTYNVLVKDTIREDTIKEKDTLSFLYDTVRLSRILRIEYKNIIEYDTILFTDTSYRDIHSIHSIQEKRKIKNYNVLLTDTIKEDTSKGKDTLSSFYNNEVNHGLYTRILINKGIWYLHCYHNGINLETNLRPCLNGRNTGTGTETIKDRRDSLFLVYEYKNGLIHGLFTIYDNGNIDYTQIYKNGERHGININYLDYPSIDYLECYQSDTLQSTETNIVNLLSFVIKCNNL